MKQGLRFEYLYHDNDIIEIRIVADNGLFRGTADVYIGRDTLSEVAEGLERFPEGSSDLRKFELGGFGPMFAGGAARLSFYTKDMAGHVVVEVTVEADCRQLDKAEHATVIADIEVAAIDQFMLELQSLEGELEGTATLIFATPQSH
jgi:hypothetical protein